MQTNDLRKVGLKVTLPRMRILDILGAAEPRHLSAEDIYRRLLGSQDDVGLATVYRVLTQFEAAGLVIRHHYEGATAVFELNEGEHHNHIVCMECGKVEEFIDPSIDARQKEIATINGYSVSNHSVILYGRCQSGLPDQVQSAVTIGMW